ncbi:MAG: ATP-dependent RecD-like DNA helicase [Holosporaceae bacterium]|jgi:exodeoxyribonuclease V alpha subunit|nr:ATP-dependent RecD-like DNA helicase [Holosporaceae bacterium]
MNSIPALLGIRIKIIHNNDGNLVLYLNLYSWRINLEELQGQLEHITYENEENGYLVAKIKIFGQNELVTAVGNMTFPIVGEILTIQGNWLMHPKFGRQFKVETCRCSVPDNRRGIEKYIGSGLIKGIGPVMAKRIVGIFKEKTLDIIDADIARLATVPGIGKQRIEMIAAAWQQQKEIRSVMIFLQSYGVGSSHATKIFKRYGDKSIEIISANPYRLANDVSGIGFITADKIAKKIGFDENSVLRAEAGLLFTLNQLSNDGHIYCPLNELVATANKLLGVDIGILHTAIQNMETARQVVLEQLLDNDLNPIECVFLSGYHFAEIQVAKMLLSIRDTPKALLKIKKSMDITASIKNVQKQLSIRLASQQIDAIGASLENKILVITGGPGTGKTTITKSILQIYAAVSGRVLLTAPTGRAAKRMAEATEFPAKTIHRLLEFNHMMGGFQKNEDNKLNCDLLVIDEASMVDLLLMYHLLRAVPSGATVIIIGDINQLPSVGAGSVLKDIIRSRQFCVVELKEIFRQAQQSSIVVNAHRIIHGEMPFCTNAERDDCFFLFDDDQERILDKILDMVQRRIPAKFNYDPMMDIQVLSPMNRGNVGTNAINHALQDALNPNGFEIIRGEKRFRVGDRVMQIRNNYDKDVFNGDIGRIIDLDVEDQTIVVQMDGKNVPYDFSEIDEIVLAYATSIHKSQGSEYPAVVIPLVTAHYVMLQRNLLYTAITRGKNLVVVVGSRKALGIAVKNNKTMQRNTWLHMRLDQLGTKKINKAGS